MLLQGTAILCGSDFGIIKKNFSILFGSCQAVHCLAKDTAAVSWQILRADDGGMLASGTGLTAAMHFASSRAYYVIINVSPFKMVFDFEVLNLYGTRPVAGRNFYRLRQNDINGKYGYSIVRQIVMSG